MTLLWQPSEAKITAARLTAFRRFVHERHGINTESFPTLHRWSVTHADDFWGDVWEFCQVKSAVKGSTVVVPGDHMLDYRFFPEASLNFTENLLQRHDSQDAVVFKNETGYREVLSFGELNDRVSRCIQGFNDCGLEVGDRVAACLPNIPDTVVVALATAATGGIFSSCSPDFGERGILDRFLQIEPKLLIAVDGYIYNGKQLDVREKIRNVALQLPSLERVITIPYLATLTGAPAKNINLPIAVLLTDFLAGFVEREIEYAHFPFNQPLYILYSSGTTGLPKCIVHGAGGTLLQHLKEHQLHCDVHPGDRVFYYTTCGWMMWNWLVTALASEATLILYDGSPFFSDGRVLWDLAEAEDITLFGTSAKYIQTMEKNGITPMKTHDLQALRTITSTGSTLLPEGFDYVYRQIKTDVCLSSISGGTDIISCFVLGDPTGPVRRGDIQAKGLGMAVEVLDDHGRSVIGQMGELACTRAFPSMPVCFWNDQDRERYRAAYFARFPGIWTHGDLAEQKIDGGYIIYGRSDAVLNPGGTRIGTAEIYRQVEGLEYVVESAAIGQEWDGDIRILLFVVLRAGVSLTDAMIQEIKQRIRDGASPRHVPAEVIQVPDIPRTRSGKITEVAIRDVIHGRHVKNLETIANPDALRYFRV